MYSNPRGCDIRKCAKCLSRNIQQSICNSHKMSDSLKKTSDSLIRSFLVSEMSNSLMDAHFWWAKWTNCSWSLIFGEQNEQFAHMAHFWWATWAIRSHRSFLVSDLSHLLTLLTKKTGNERESVKGGTDLPLNPHDPPPPIPYPDWLALAPLAVNSSPCVCVGGGSISLSRGEGLGRSPNIATNGSPLRCGQLIAKCVCGGGGYPGQAVGWLQNFCFRNFAKFSQNF